MKKVTLTTTLTDSGHAFLEVYKEGFRSTGWLEEQSIARRRKWMRRLKFAAIYGTGFFLFVLGQIAISTFENWQGRLLLSFMLGCMIGDLTGNARHRFL